MTDIMPLEFRYFRGPESDMVGLLPGILTCSLCGQPGRCFSLERRVVSRELTEKERQGKIGCIDCLKQDRFGFSHRTEAGYIDEDGLMIYDNEEEQGRVFVVAESGQTTTTGGPFVSPPHEHVSDEAILELPRTPIFSTWQDLDWPVHHEDFMAYLGIWGPKDFEQFERSGEGRNLYLEMVNSAWYDLWPESEEPLFGENIIAFQCLHCATRIGIPDFD